MTSVHYGLNSFLPLSKSKSVYWFSDNQAAGITLTIVVVNWSFSQLHLMYFLFAYITIFRFSPTGYTKT